MHSFYLFEGSKFQGGGGWEDIHVLNNPADVRSAVADYLRTGAWTTGPGDEFCLDVYQRGDLAVTKDLYPFLRLKIPGLTEIRFGAGGGTVDRIGLEPRSKYQEWFEDSIFDEQDGDERAEALWELLTEEFDTMLDAGFGVDWESVSLPELVSPVLPQGIGVTIQGRHGSRELTYGFNTCF